MKYLFIVYTFLNFLIFLLVPGEPQDFKVVKTTSHTIELEWKPPRRDEQSSSSGIKGYEIHYFKVNPSASSPSASDFKSETQVFKKKTNVNKLKYTLTDLEPNSLYKIQIFAYNMKGDGQRSNALLVTTLDEGPNKPENIRSEINNDILHIKWQPPSKTSTDRVSISAKDDQQQVGGYRLYFNNEKYEVDSKTTEMKFARPKWGKWFYLLSENTLNTRIQEYYFINTSPTLLSEVHA